MRLTVTAGIKMKCLKPATGHLSGSAPFKIKKEPRRGPFLLRFVWIIFPEIPACFCNLVLPSVMWRFKA